MRGRSASRVTPPSSSRTPPEPRLTYASRVTPDEFGEVLDAVVHALRRVSNDDWSERAGDLEWSCWQTADHMIDVVFSYALQFAAGAQGGFLPFQELHAQPGAAPSDLIEGVEAVSSMLAALVRQAPPTATASDGVLPLDGSD